MPYYFLKNLQGDVVSIINSAGVKVVEYTYDAWGNVLSVTGSLATTIGQLNPFRYRGYYYDTETGFYYLQSRYYDPTIGRFLNADAFVSTGQGILGNNMFAYCGNNPVMRADPSGELWWLVPVIVIPLILTGCSSEPDTEPLYDTLADNAPKTQRYNRFSDALEAGFNEVETEYFRQKKLGNDWEHQCIIYEYNGGFYVSRVYTDRSFNSIKYRPSIVSEGTAVAAIHTHPNGTLEVFSVNDWNVARDNNIDSYVTIVGYDPYRNDKRFCLPRDASDCTKYYSCSLSRDSLYLGGLRYACKV